MQIAIFTKHALTGEALTSFLTRKGHFGVVGHTTDILACLRLIADQGADVLLADKAMTDEARAYVEGARLVQGFSLVLLGDPATEPEVEETPILSYFSPGEELFSMLRSVKTEPETKRRLRNHDRSGPGLSPRESEIANLVAKGFSNRQIAETARIGDQTVKNMVSKIMTKLGCENRTQLALKFSSPRD